MSSTRAKTFLLMTMRDEERASVKALRRVRLRYAALTGALVLSQLWAFVFVRDLYPLTAWQMMAGGVQRGRDYYMLRGETISGETIDLPPLTLTPALRGRAWGLVEATVNNGSFRLRWNYPANDAVLKQAGGFAQLPRGARVPDLLRAWGAIYNERLAPDSLRRLRAMRLDAYRWNGGYSPADQTYVTSWRAEL